MCLSFTQRLSKLGGGRVTLSYFDRGRTKCAKLVLDQPTKKNALSGKMMAELNFLVRELEYRTDVAVLLLKGSSGFFCAGADRMFLLEFPQPLG